MLVLNNRNEKEMHVRSLPLTVNGLYKITRSSEVVYQVIVMLQCIGTGIL